MDPNVMMFAAALLSAAEQGMTIADGTTPTFAVAEDGAVTVTAGEQSVAADAESLAELGAALAEIYADEDEADEADAEAPAEASAA